MNEEQKPQKLMQCPSCGEILEADFSLQVKIKGIHIRVYSPDPIIEQPDKENP